MAELADWQQRVVQERDELQKKIAALTQFLEKSLEGVVDYHTAALMRLQLDTMQTYERILEMRIGGF